MISSQIKNTILKHFTVWSSLGIMLILFFGCIVPAYKFHLNFKAEPSYILSLFIVLVFLGFWWRVISFKLNSKNFIILLTILSIATWILRYLFVFKYQQNYYSDFKTMWNHAIKLVESGWIRPDRLQTERPLASLVPLVAIFGHSTAVFKIFNITVITLQNLMCASLSARWFSPLAGILCFILLSFIPEFYFASLIPTHDISGSFYLVLYLWLFNIGTTFSSQKKKLYIFSIFFVLTIIGLLLDIQRNLFLLAWLATLIFSLLTFLTKKPSQEKDFIKWILFALILQIISFNIIKTALISGGVLFPRNPSDKTWNAFTYSHSFSSGYYSRGQNFWKKYAWTLGSKPKKHNYIITNTDDLFYYASAIRGSDLFYNYSEKPKNYLSRLRRLTRLGNVNFYYTRLAGYNKKEQELINLKFGEINKVHNKTYSILLLFTLSLLFLASFFKSRINHRIYLPILCSGLLIIALGLIGENQPRYLFICWSLWTIIIVGCLDFIFSHKLLNKAVVSVLVKLNTKLYPPLSFKIHHHTKKEQFLPLQFSFPAICSFICIIFATISTFFILFSVSDYRLINMKTFSHPVCSKHFSNEECRNSQVNFKKTIEEKPYAMLKLKHPAGLYKGARISTSRQLKVETDQAYVISLYVNSPNKDDLNGGFFDIKIYINNQLKETLSVSKLDKNRYLKYSDIKSKDGFIDLKFEIKSLVEQEVLPSTLSKLAVNFEFLSLRKQKV